MAQDPQQTTNTVDYTYQNLYQNPQYYQQYQYYNSYPYQPTIPTGNSATPPPPPPPPLVQPKIESSTPPPPGVENYNQKSNLQITTPPITQAQTNYTLPYYQAPYAYSYTYYPPPPPSSIPSTTTSTEQITPPGYRNPYTSTPTSVYQPPQPYQSQSATIYSEQQPTSYSTQPQPPAYITQAPTQPSIYTSQSSTYTSQSSYTSNYQQKQQSLINNNTLSTMPSVTSNNNTSNLSFKISNKKIVKKEIFEPKNNNNNNFYNQIKLTVNNNANAKEDNSFKPAYIAVNPITMKKEIDDKNDKNASMTKINNNKKDTKVTNNTNNKKESNKKEGTEYPKALEDYIKRMFQTCPPSKINILENELMKMITDAKLRNALNTIKWENMGLPIKCQEDEPSEKLEQLQINKKKRKRNIINVTNSPYSSTSPVEVDDSLIKLPEKERMEEIKRREKRAKRFNDDYSIEMKKKQEKEQLQQQAEITKQIYISQNGNPDVVDWDQDTLVGTCQDLEKNYLRLTSAPDPATVRPLPILRKTLELLKEKWKKEQNYNYICDQFKSLRQDLTVQRIKNDFAVQVYEIHARIALEKGDLGEYNQCQSQLKQLYKLGFKGNGMEFTAYRLLYYLHTLNPKDINEMISELTKEQKEHVFIKHALDVRSAVANGNYHKLFQLYINPPANMACYLMDHFVDRERIKALKVMTKAYLNLNIEFITDELGFDSVNDCLSLLRSIKCPIERKDNKQYYIPCKDAYPVLNKKWLELTKRGIDIKGQI